MKIYTGKYFNKVLNKEYLTSSIEELETYGEFYFLTQIGEIGYLNCLQNAPESISNIEHFLQKNHLYIKLTKRDQLHLLQNAWRFFSDKSEKGHRWYMWKIYGIPEIKGLFINENPNDVSTIETFENDIEPTPITFKKWDSQSSVKKEELIDRFAKNPTDQSAPILDDYFHNEL